MQWVWPLPLFIAATFAPESPWWLVRAGQLERAEESIRRLSSKHSAVDPAQTVAMMVRTNQHELANQPGVSFTDCFKGSDLRRTEIACVAWAIQQLCGSPIGNTGVYFFEQGPSLPLVLLDREVLLIPAAGLAQTAAFKFGIGMYAIGFVGTCASWVTMTVSVAGARVHSADGQFIGRRKVYVGGLSALCMLWVAHIAGVSPLICRLLIIGCLAVPSRAGNQNAKWGQSGIILLWVLIYDFTVGVSLSLSSYREGAHAPQPLAYAIVGEVSSTRLRTKTVGLARNCYNVVQVVSVILITYMINPAAWNLHGFAAFFWVRLLSY